MGTLELETHYDMAGRITHRRCTDNLRDRLVSERRYQWDRADQIIRRMYTDGAPSTPAEKYRQSLWGYDAAGRMTQNLRFRDQYLDRETGLHYNIFRYYDPAGGCYMQMDPIGLAGGLNTYMYVPNALIYIDPLGLDYTTWQIHPPGYGDSVQKGFISTLQEVLNYLQGLIIKVV